jgi:signal transduction histidine kinase
VPRLRSWLDPGVPSSVPAGLATSVLSIAAVTLLIFPLKRIFDAGSLDAMYIPVVLFLAAKWNLWMGVFATILGALGFTYYHVEPVHRFSGFYSEALAFLAVVAGAAYVYIFGVRARAAEERRRLEVVARGRIVAAADEERRRVVRDLHDGAQQRLAAAALMLNSALDRFDDPDARELVEQARGHTEQANRELRELAHGILPPALTRGGLRAGVKALVSRMTLPVTVDVPAERYPPAIEASAYFIISEALTNVVKHSRAERAAVRAAVRDGQLSVEVSDDGIGGARVAGGHGLVGLDDRVSALGGKLVVDSPSGRGTRIRALLPVAA